MGVVETLVHTHDLAAGLGLAPGGAGWKPPADLVARSLQRIFPDAPEAAEADPWSALLWCTGRLDLPGRGRRSSWRWYAAPRSAADAVSDSSE
jgi:hypothetical protein